MSTSVTRRSTLTAAAVAVAGLVGGFIYGRNSDAAKPVVSGNGEYTRPSGSGGSTSSAPTLIAPLDQVPTGGGLITDGLVLTRSSGDTVKAFSSKCTHLGCTVNRVNSGKIFCPCHGSVFDASTGAVVQGPAGSPLPSVPVTVMNGGIYVA